MAPSEVKDSPTGWVKEHIDSYVSSGGKDGHEWRGAPTLLLTTVGRKTGERRRTPLIYGRAETQGNHRPTSQGNRAETQGNHPPDRQGERGGDDYVVVASQGGRPANPAWYLNLEAEPRVEVQVRGEVFTAIARPAGPAERERLWPLMAEIWPAYDEYQAKTGRVIPVVLLTRA